MYVEEEEEERKPGWDWIDNQIVGNINNGLRLELLIIYEFWFLSLEEHNT
jgi:hypothetical protein